MTMEVMIQICSVISFISAAIAYVVIRPLDKSINELGRSLTKLETQIDRLATSIDDEKEERMKLHSELVKVEESVKSAHHRIDRLEEKS